MELPSAVTPGKDPPVTIQGRVLQDKVIQSLLLSASDFSPSSQPMKLVQLVNTISSQGFFNSKEGSCLINSTAVKMLKQL